MESYDLKRQKLKIDAPKTRWFFESKYLSFIAKANIYAGAISDFCYSLCQNFVRLEETPKKGLNYGTFACRWNKRREKTRKSRQQRNSRVPESKGEIQSRKTGKKGKREKEKREKGQE